MATQTSPVVATTDCQQSTIPPTRIVWVMRCICTIAVAISGYLAWTAFQAGEVYGCAGGATFDCGHVLTSKWSKVWDIPVSVPAFGLYASLIAVLAFVKPSTPQAMMKRIWSVLVPCSVCAGLAAVWFIGLQVFAIGHLCPYCLVAHTCGLTMAGLVLFYSPIRVAMTAKLSSLSVLAIAGLITVQAIKTTWTSMIHVGTKSSRLSQSGSR